MKRTNFISIFAYARGERQYSVSFAEEKMAQLSRQGYRLVGFSAFPAMDEGPSVCHAEGWIALMQKDPK